MSKVSVDAGMSDIGDHVPPIDDTDPHVLRARRTAAWTRAALGAMGIALILADSSLLSSPSIGRRRLRRDSRLGHDPAVGPRVAWLRTEESLAGVAGLSIMGLQTEHVSVISIVWLAAVASGVLARGGRVHWIGRTVVLVALALPIVSSRHLTLEYAALCGAALGMLLTSGRLTRELNHLLHQARYDADHDDLTGLLSYAAFRVLLEREVENAGAAPVSLLLLDLERFGVVNKTHGHAAGDALLAAVGERLLAVAGAERPVGRLGGDEFAVISHARTPPGWPARSSRSCPSAPRRTASNLGLCGHLTPPRRPQQRRSAPARRRHRPTGGQAQWPGRPDLRLCRRLAQRHRRALRPPLAGAA